MHFIALVGVFGAVSSVLIAVASGKHYGNSSKVDEDLKDLFESFIKKS
ncbi:hypothetical protein [Flammeovirga pectinis]|nr:hypothetical protein [Flammeovirga pectinis]